MGQNLYTENPVRGLPGDWAGGSTRDSATVVAAPAEELGSTGVVIGGPQTPGRLTVRVGQSFDEHPLSSPPIALLADATAFIATGASSGSQQVISGIGLDGSVGQANLIVPSFVDLVLSSNADWDATVATLTGTSSDGSTISESLSIPDNGNATVTTTQAFWSISSLTIPAQSGAGGTFTLGVSASGRSLGPANLLGIVEIDEQNPDQVAITDQRAFSAAFLGRFYVETEQPVSVGAPAFVSVSGANPGVFRADDDGGAAVAVPGLRYVETVSPTLAVVQIGVA